MVVVHHLKGGEKQKEVLEAEDDEEKDSEKDVQVQERVTQRGHETVAMTMRRTRHQLQPQCVHKNQSENRKTVTTKTL